MQQLPLKDWYDTFNRAAGDLYPGRYTREYTTLLTDTARRVLELARDKGSLIVAHNYQFPELQEVAEEVGDSLGLSRYVARRRAPRVELSAAFGSWEKRPRRS